MSDAQVLALLGGMLYLGLCIWLGLDAIAKAVRK